MQDVKGFLMGINLPEREATDLLGISKVKSLANGAHFLTEGQVPAKFGIVLDGLLRYYYLNDNGDEFTKSFIPAGNVVSAYTAMLQQTPSLFFIQALEKSEVLEINYKQWLALQQQNSYWDKFLIQALEKGYAAKEKRERELLLLDAESRYKIFLEEFPGLDKRVKLQIVASYLGIKPESLSRIRKKPSHLT